MKQLYSLLFIFLSAAFLINPDTASGQSFEIVDPGPQPPMVYFDLQLINARDEGGNFRNGAVHVEIIGTESSRHRTLYFSDATFSEGVAFITIRLPWSGNWLTEVVVDYDYSGAQFITLSTDRSGFTIISPGTQIAGIPFSIDLTAGKDFNNNDLTGNILVTVSTSNPLEGASGQLFSSDVSFSTGEATITDPGIVLTIAESQTLTITVAGVTDPETTDILVNAAPASKMVITTQPANVTGNFDDSPVTLSAIVLETQDAYNNPSVAGFSSSQNVTASLSSNPGNATLGGITTIDIQSGTASFNSITIDEEGSGYTLNFTSDSPVLLTPVLSDAFNVNQLYNLSEFTVTSPLPSSVQYQDVDFQIQLTGAVNNIGENLSGTSNVIVTSSTEGIVFNNTVNFTNGSADFLLALANLGSHTLTISVEGIDTDEIINLTVNADLSGFLAANPGSPQYSDFPFSINITDAKDRAGLDLSGEVSVTVTSSIVGIVFNQAVNFAVGSGSIQVSLSTLGIHNLTISIAGITEEKILTGISVLANLTNFSIEETSTPSQTAGVNSVINIINATNLSGLLAGPHNVTVTSDITGEGNNGEVFNEAVSFTGGSASFNVNLETAATHILTVTIEGITPVRTHQIVVTAAEVASMIITQQPAGGNGVNNDVAVNVGTITLRTVDQFGNFSVLNLAGDQIITANISTDASALNDANLGGTLTSSISSGTATFTNLTLDRDGTGYTLSFSYTGSPVISAVTSDPFNMTNVEDQSGFEIVPPGPQVMNLPFNLRLINARDSQGNPFNILKRVTINRISPNTGVEFNSDVQFIDGEVSVPMTITSTGDFSFTVTVDLNLVESFTTVVTTDGSGFTMALDPAGNQTAGAPFDIDITDAKDATATLLSGNRLVTVTSNNLSEGNNGVLFNGYIAFTGGSGSVNGLFFERAGIQTLTVEIDWVKTPRYASDIIVNPGPASVFLITQQPAGSLEGTNNNAAISVGTVILQIQDSWGNISTNGLSGDLTVAATITGNPEGVTLGGTTNAVISSGTATFSNLTLDKNGEYTLSFTYNGTAPVFVPNPVISTNISITNLEDLSGFSVLPEPGTKYENIPFLLNITNARDITGILLNEPVVVTVAYGVNEVYSSSTGFTDGSASFNISLPAGTENLTVNVAGITNNVIITDFVVVTDQSTFTLALDPGPYYINNPFNLLINGARDRDNVLLSGNINVIITSNQPGEDVYNATANFVEGNAVISLTMTTPANHTLTVQVEGVTTSGNIAVNVEDNISDFNIELASAGDKTAGSAFGLNVSSATGMSGTTLTGEFLVTLTSDVAVEVPISQIVTFTSGTASFNIDLKTAGAHILSVSIQSITPVKTLNVTVVAATATRLGIVQQPAGGQGANDDVPVGTGTVIVQTQDAFGNLSVLGLSGTQQVTAAVSDDASHSSVSVILGGTTTVNITDGTATFGDLTINRDGIGYTLSFSYSGEPLMTPVISDPFDITNVNQYLISLKDGENPVASPLVFNAATVGYSSLTARAITITREGSGIIQSLAVGKSGDNAASYTITAPLLTTLDATNQVTTFTLKPNDGLEAGTYNAIITVTADNDIAESFNVQFQVLATYAISLDAADPTVYTSVYEGYSQIDEIIVTITNTGGNDITGLATALAGANPTAFVTGALSANTIVPGATSTFTIRPATGLEPGIYTATVTVNNTQEVPQSFAVTFEVLANTYTISLDPEGNIDFGLIPPGTSPEQNITITRTGTGVINNLAVAVSSTDHFAVTQPGVTSLDGDTPFTSFTVQPAAGLTAGTYTGTVTISATSMTNVTFDVTVRVVSEMVWTGSSGNNWHTPDNWNPSVVPDQDSYVIIPSSGSQPVVSSVNVIVNNLVIGNGAELTVNSDRRLTIRSGGRLTVQPGGRLTSTGTLVNNAGTGGIVVESDANASGSVIQNSSGVQATVQGYVSGAQWHIISSPVSGQSINGFMTNPENNISYNSSGGFYAMTHYDENRFSGSGGWSTYYTSSTSGNMGTGTGYLARRGDSNPLSFAGQLAYSNVSIPITRNGHGWNAIGNPFPSAIGVSTDAVSASKFLEYNAGQLETAYAGVYIYDPATNTYEIINNVGGSQPYISTGQGFIVKSRIGGGNITFTTGMRFHDNNTTIKSVSFSPWYIVKLKVSNENKSTSTLLAFNSYMTKGLDPTYDGGQFGADAGFRLYSRLLEDDSNINFTIQALPDNFYEDMVIPVGFDFSEGGDVTFSAGELRLPEGVSAILEDRALSEFTDLTKNNYTVTLTANSAGPGRFYLHTGILITEVDEPQFISDEKNLSIYAYDREVFIIGETGKNSYATLVDLMGRTVKKVKLENSERNSFRVDELARGFYLVRVSGSGNQSKKVYIE
jgi:hypothetical protein